MIYLQVWVYSRKLSSFIVAVVATSVDVRLGRSSTKGRRVAVTGKFSRKKIRERCNLKQARVKAS